MPGGSIGPITTPPGHGTVDTACYKYAGGQLIPLPLVRWVEISEYRGPQPPRATFRYAYPPSSNNPVLFEHFLPVRSDQVSVPPDLLKVDDRIVVIGMTPQGQQRYLFDGFVQIPEGRVSGDSYSLPFQAQGTPIRCWDQPIQGSVRRSVFTPSNFLLDFDTDLPARVNPDGKPNGTAYGAGTPTFDWDHRTDVNTLGRTFRFPVFFDELYPTDSPLHDDASKPYVRKWDLGMAARYLLAKGNGLEQYVENPDFDSITNALSAAVPLPGKVIDPTDNTTFEYVLVTCPDTVLSSRPWPEVLQQLIAPHGFNFCFRLEADSGGFPRWRLEFFRERDNIGAVYKDLQLQAAGATLDITQSNTRQFAIARDASQIVNSYRAYGAINEYEVGFVLAPMFEIDGDDINNTKDFKTGNNNASADTNKYRLFGIDECGEGHWSYSANAFVQGTGRQFDFTPLFGAGKWVVRRRPPGGQLFSRDPNDNRRKAFLGLLTNWDGEPPAIWDRKGEFRPLKTSMNLENFRTGVRLTCNDPSKLAIGDAVDAASTLAANEIDVVQRLVATLTIPNSLGRVHFVLFCTVPADEALTPTSGRRAASPTGFSVQRIVEADDRYKQQYIHRSSHWFNTTTTGVLSSGDDWKLVRDDLDAGYRYVQSKRSATESPSFGGNATIGRLVNSYQVGDRVRKIDGRMSLQANVNTENKEGPRYPSVVSRIWTNEPDQSTVLQLDDRRAEGEPIEA